MDLLETLDKDLPLRDDIRLLGRILGDTVRSQEGVALPLEIGISPINWKGLLGGAPRALFLPAFRVA
jgi:hypothetical protein